MISVGFPRKIIVNEDSQKFSYFNLFNMLISILKWRSGLLLCLFSNILKLVLSIFRESLFSLNQLEIFFNSIFISFLVGYS